MMIKNKKFSITLTQSGMPSKYYVSTDGHSQLRRFLRKTHEYKNNRMIFEKMIPGYGLI